MWDDDWCTKGRLRIQISISVSVFLDSLPSSGTLNRIQHFINLICFCQQVQGHLLRWIPYKMLILVSITEFNNWHKLPLTGSKWVCVSPPLHLRLEIDLVSEILFCFFNTIWWRNPRNTEILRIQVFLYIALCCWCFPTLRKNVMPSPSRADGPNPCRWRHYIMLLWNVRKY